ncbi:MAG TPA: pitrilysin family protein [Bryobacteraceae bacterium]
MRTMRLITTTLAVGSMLLVCAQEVRLPHYTRQVLPNGVVVNFMQRTGVPMVEFHLAVRGGDESDPADMAGLSAVTAVLLRRGTKNRTADQFSEQLDSLGGSFFAGTQTGSPATMMNAAFLSKDLAAGLDLFADAVLNPTFPEAEVKKTLAQRIDAVRSSKDNLQAANGEYFRAFYYGPDHPYGHVATEATLGKIDRNAIVEDHRKFYCGRNMILTVAGSFDESEALAAIKKTFGGLAEGAMYVPVKDAKPEAGARLLLIDKPDATQTYFAIGMPGVPRNNPDRFKLQVLNTLFGGRFTSILNDELRVNTGLTYGAGSVVEQQRLPGAIIIRTYTKTETTERAMDTALALLKKFNEKGITAQQLSSAKAYIKGEYPPRHLETAGQLASILTDMELFGLSRGEVDDFFSGIDSVSLEQADEAAHKYYSPASLTFTVLGNASKIKPFVSKYAPKIVEVEWKTPGFPTR